VTFRIDRCIIRWAGSEIVRGIKPTLKTVGGDGREMFPQAPDQGDAGDNSLPARVTSARK